MTTQSAIYEGWVRHRRREPSRVFTFPLFMVYLDLAEVDRVFSMTRLWGRSRLCPASFRRSDYLAPHAAPLEEAVRQRVEAALGRRPHGPIRMLTHLRYFGYIFNPVTFYYCFDDCDRVSAIVAEITNTPWGERHAYVLDAERLTDDAAGRQMRWRFGKEFHVSPFLPRDMRYDWMFTSPAERLLVHMDVCDRDPAAPRAFDATLRLQRRDMTPARLRMLLVRYPLLTAQVILKIYFEALCLWLRRARVHPHPGSVSSTTEPTV